MFLYGLILSDHNVGVVIYTNIIDCLFKFVDPLEGEGGFSGPL